MLHLPNMPKMILLGSVRGITMPSVAMMQHFRHKYKTPGSSADDFARLEEMVRPVRNAYLDPFNRTNRFPTTHKGRDLEIALDIMESFARYLCITSIPFFSCPGDEDLISGLRVQVHAMLQETG
jgi:hypothetical protein